MKKFFSDSLVIFFIFFIFFINIKTVDAQTINYKAYKNIGLEAGDEFTSNPVSTIRVGENVQFHYRFNDYVIFDDIENNIYGAKAQLGGGGIGSEGCKFNVVNNGKVLHSYTGDGAIPTTLDVPDFVYSSSIDKNYLLLHASCDYFFSTTTPYGSITEKINKTALKSLTVLPAGSSSIASFPAKTNCFPSTFVNTVTLPAFDVDTVLSLASSMSLINVPGNYFKINGKDVSSGGIIPAGDVIIIKAGQETTFETLDQYCRA